MSRFISIRLYSSSLFARHRTSCSRLLIVAYSASSPAGRCGRCLAKQKVYAPHRLAHLHLGWARQAGDKLFLHGKDSFPPVPPLRFALNLELLESLGELRRRGWRQWSCTRMFQYPLADLWVSYLCDA